MKKEELPIFRCKNRKEEFYQTFCKRVKQDLKNILGNNLPTNFKALEITTGNITFLASYYDIFRVENSNLCSNNIFYLGETDDGKIDVCFGKDGGGEMFETMDEVSGEWVFVLTSYDIREYLTKEELDSIIDKDIIPKDIDSAIKKLKSELKCEKIYIGFIKRDAEKINYEDIYRCGVDRVYCI